jgi:hypothetical protein
LRDLLSEAVIDLAGGDVQLKPYQFLWLK